MLFGFDVDAAFAEMNALTRQMDGLASRGLDGRHGLRPIDTVGNPFVEQNGALVWTADLPGVTRDGLKVTVENGVLTIEARRADTKPDGHTVRYSERRPFELRRSVELPDTVDVEGISASLENGVLTLQLPKKPESRPCTIEIKAS
jgi:HSP20 family protein